MRLGLVLGAYAFIYSGHSAVIDFVGQNLSVKCYAYIYQRTWSRFRRSIGWIRIQDTDINFVNSCKNLLTISVKSGI